MISNRSRFAASSFRVVLGLIVCISEPVVIFGCECVEVPPASAFAGAAVVFSGRVQQVQHAVLVESVNPETGKGELRPPEQGDLTLVTFSVKNAWKGALGATVSVMATVHGTVCPGYRFEAGHDYVVYAVDPLALNPARVRHLSKGARVFEVSDCPLRVRTDVTAEARLLDILRAASLR